MTLDGVERFIIIQNKWSNYERALREVKNQKKVSHWIWHIFPQMRGLGYSQMAKNYGIYSLDEAKIYYEHPLLRKRLEEITLAFLTQEDSAESVFGGIDAKKVASCMTLFDLIAPDGLFGKVLEKFYGGRRCGKTLALVDVKEQGVE
ncbi:MAG: DUF1810 domain-containing protein [Phocaeicola sp.]